MCRSVLSIAYCRWQLGTRMPDVTALQTWLRCIRIPTRDQLNDFLFAAKRIARLQTVLQTLAATAS